MAAESNRATECVATPDTAQLSGSNRDVVEEATATPTPLTRPLRPPMTAREHSAHVYSLPERTPSQLEAGLPEPQRAHVRRRGSESFPLESVITVKPSRGSLSRPPAPSRNFSGSSAASSGISLQEVAVPEAMREKLESQDPGPYQCTFTTNASGKPYSFDSIDGVVGEKAEVSYERQRLDTYDSKVATMEQLQRLLKDYPMPKTQGPEWLNRPRYGFFSTYRRLFTLILLINLAVIVAMAVRTSRDPAIFTYADATTAVAVNLFVSMLLRHEHFVNLVFRISLSVPHSLPVSIRRHAAKCYSYGGVHSSCGLSAALWYIFFAVLVVNNFVSDNHGEGDAVAVLTACMLFVFMILLTMSIPQVRREFHDAWEISHRFAGWTAFALIWAQTIVIAYSNGRQQDRSMGLILVETPAFWLLIAITYLLVYPWARMRRHTVRPEPLSSHAIRLHFDRARPLSTCMGIKLSSSPLLENHGFATIPYPSGEKGFSCIVSDAGDWTKNLIRSQPTKLWTRGAPVMGVMRLCFAFRRIVVVATGSGIGPCMSFLAVHPEWDYRILWSARMPVVTFGKEIVEAVFRADEKAVVIDSEKMKKRPKPQLGELAYAMYKESEAEAVVIISNPRATQSVVYALEARKVPAFGAIFDS